MNEVTIQSLLAEMSIMDDEIRNLKANLAEAEKYISDLEIELEEARTGKRVRA